MNNDRNDSHDNGPEQEIDDLLSLPEVAELLRLSDATLRYWRSYGIGPTSFKVGRHVRYQRRDVQNWLRAQRNTGSSDVA